MTGAELSRAYLAKAGGTVEWIPTERYGPLEGQRAQAAAQEALALAVALIEDAAASDAAE